MNTSKQTPGAFFQSVLGRPVVVKLYSGVTYHGAFLLHSVPSIVLSTLSNHNFYFLGILACMDGYMNIAMEQTQEYFNGKLKNTYADTFIRGNNGSSWILPNSTSFQLPVARPPPQSMHLRLVLTFLPFLSVVHTCSVECLLVTMYMAHLEQKILLNVSQIVRSKPHSGPSK